MFALAYFRRGRNTKMAGRLTTELLALSAAQGIMEK
jgi:hypothetical protein